MGNVKVRCGVLSDCVSWLMATESLASGKKVLCKGSHSTFAGDWWSVILRARILDNKSELCLNVGHG